MGAALSGTAAGASQFSSSTTMIGTSLWTGIVFAWSWAASFGAYIFSILCCCCSCSSGCLAKTSSEVLRPVSEWENSEAKRGGGYLCCSACLIVCIVLTLLSLLVAFIATLIWYSTVGQISPIVWPTYANGVVEKDSFSRL